jgi:hypothetical protein
MAAKLIVLAFLLTLGTSAQTLPKFMGREVTIIKPELEDGLFPKGPATVCIEGPPRRQCYTAPKDFGRDPEIHVMQLDKDTSALFFSAASGGVSGWQVHFALLRPGTEKELWDSFPDITVSNQSQHAFWNEPSISAAPIFVIAEYVQSLVPAEGHYGKHRYMASAYIRAAPSDDADVYQLQDRYMTAHKYDLEASGDVLASEKQEILARLRRVKAATQSQQ